MGKGVGYIRVGVLMCVCMEGGYENLVKNLEYFSKILGGYENIFENFGGL